MSLIQTDLIQDPWVSTVGNSLAPPSNNEPLHYTCRQHFNCLWCYVKPWLGIQNLCSSCYERLCFIWCPVHYCQHIWKVLSLETSPILFQAGLNISRQEAENETFPQETACGAFYLVQQSEGLILCKTHLNKQLFVCRTCEIFLYFLRVVQQENRE